METILDKLKEPFPYSVISWRLGATNKEKTKGIALAYIDARDVMKRLDDVVGIDGWQCKYPFKGCCELSIRINGEWITKSNGAGETQVEAEKGEYSDAFKRAAILFGIGRYLYYLDTQWVPIEQSGASYIIAKGFNPVLPAWALPKEKK